MDLHATSFYNIDTLTCDSSEDKMSDNLEFISDELYTAPSTCSGSSVSCAMTDNQGFYRINEDAYTKFSNFITAESGTTSKAIVTAKTQDSSYSTAWSSSYAVLTNSLDTVSSFYASAVTYTSKNAIVECDNSTTYEDSIDG